MKRAHLLVLILIVLFVLLNSEVLGNSVTGDAFRPRFRNLFSRAPSPPVQLPPTANQNPKGWFDKADCGFLSGWTCDPNNYAASVNVYFYEGSNLISKVVANKQRESAVAQQCGGNANHGFLIGTPTSLKDDKQHTIIAKAIDVNTGAQIPLSGNPKTLTCSPGVMVCGGACNNGVCPAEFRGGCSNGVCVDPVCTEDDQGVSYKGPACSNGADDDADGKIDCQDSGCASASNCIPQYNCGAACGTITNVTNTSTISCPTGLTCQNNKCYSSNCQESASVGNCGDNLDNDFDNTIDCSDSSCSTSNNCIESSTLVSSCKDNKDNDLDGQIDCQDSGCATYCSNLGPESSSNNNCADGMDNDGDGFTDCFDPLCGPATSCQENPTNNNCADSIDNDWDSGTSPFTLRDCADSGCYGSSSCQQEAVQFCLDSGDNDGDGLTDCKDPDCFNECIERDNKCLDNVDNNKDGLTDAADPTCSFFIVETNGKGCIDSLDNDKNGLTDCLDPACKQHPLCGEGGFNCFDNQDNDGDGQLDCKDTKCVQAGACGPVETVCEDDKDNDQDGLRDCADADCTNSNSCVCGDTDGGTNVGTFGSITVKGVPTYYNYDYCHPSTGTGPTTLLREGHCYFNWAFTSMYGHTPGTYYVDCSQLSGYTKCVNGRCV